MQKLQFKTTDGDLITYSIDEDETELFLPFHQIETIDLEPCSAMSNLTSLSLNSNRIVELDLSPLAGCSKLATLRLHGNSLSDLDLSALKTCRRLRELNLSFNKLDSIDLSPLNEHEFIERLNLSINNLSHISSNESLDLRGLTELRLNGNKFTSIDLSCFRNSPRLSQLRLSHNNLEAIDLSFLKTSPLFEELIISHNELVSIDFTVFASHESIKKIDVSHNNLEVIDLWPLRNCKELVAINLYNNYLQEVEITPLYRRSKKIHVGLGKSTTLLLDKILESIDPTPYHNWRCKLDINYRSVCDRVSLNGWQEVRSKIYWLLDSLPRKDTFHFRSVFMESLGMGELAGFNGDLIDLLDRHAENCDCEDVRDSIYQEVYGAVESQIENGGPTLFFNIDRIAASRSAKLVSKLIERRKIEVEEISLPVNDGQVDIRPLWLTGYGYDILSSLETPKTSVSVPFFKRIQESFKEIGVTLNTEPGSHLKRLPARFRSFRRELVDHVLMT